MKKLFLMTLLAAFIATASAQEEGKIRGGLDFGLATPFSGYGGTMALDLRYNITDNINAGIKIGASPILKDIVTLSSTAFNATGCFTNSYLVTGDYYFNDGSSDVAPYLGGGLGLFTVKNLQIDYLDGRDDADFATLLDTYVGMENTPVFGGMIRGGIEVGHFRVGLEYYLLPKTALSKMTDFNNYTIDPFGDVSNSFLNLNIGFYLGGGSWGK